MNPLELAAQCAKQINECAALGIDAKSAGIAIVTPKGWKAPPRFPRGQIVQWKEDGTRVRYLPAMNTLAWLAAHFPDQVKVAPIPPATDGEAEQPSAEAIVP